MGLGILSRLASRLPPSWIRGIGRLRERVPFTGPVIRWLARDVLAAQGVIRNGVGAGLNFDARHGSFGYLVGTTEPEEQAILAKYLKPGGVFYDLGANIGFFAIIGAKLVGSAGRVYAFEPNPECAAQVKRNAELNGFAHVEVIEAAVSSQSGRTRLHLGSTNLSSSIADNSADDGIDVALISIDDFVRDRSARGPTLVMIDVEGAEIDALRGMADTIARHRPVILCEVHWINADFLKYCAEELTPIGYNVQPLEGDAFPTEPARFHALMIPSDTDASSRKAS
jgi:FkbM family methyltransferase